MKVDVTAGGGGVTKGGTVGPERVTRVLPVARTTSIGFPGMPSRGLLGVATATRSTGAVDLGSQLGRGP
jgi:hypothetical protein